MKKQLMATMMASSLVLAGCATNGGYNGTAGNQQGMNKAVLGALAGAALGAGISKASGGDKTGRDAAIGAALGAGVGYYMEQQARQLQKDMAGTGVKVELNPNTNEIDIVMPSNITFDTNQSAVKANFQSTLNQLASTLGQYNKTTVIVKGHTDSSGSAQYNQGLSEDRAYAVASYLNRNGVTANRISTIGYGESRPVATNETESGKALNRRVEIKVNAPKNMS